MKRLVELKDLKTHFFTDEGVVKAVDGVSFHIGRGETLGVVGESGCGKSVTALSILRLFPSPPGKIVGGDILFEGKSILRKTEAEMRDLRGDHIAMIFQEPMTSLNPVFTCGDQIAEAIEVHQGLSRKEALEKAVDMLRLVGIPLPERRIHEYPHQLSGGMRQRVMIGMALSCNPKLLMADEPTTALDVTIQAQILELMKKLKGELGMAIMLITHDLGVIAEMAQRVVVMYAGKVVEEADVVSLFRKPLHPYSEGLLNSIPRLNRPKGRLHVIPGYVPNPVNLPPGCRFGPRCAYVEDMCREKEPELVDIGGGRLVSCWVRAGGRREEVA
ncbi:MAG: ABC transporter ATP-binding protein [Bacillota bacterium]|nr:MAG: ABC transporter ATP-binding protein [Bacillota bacterium]